MHKETILVACLVLALAPALAAEPASPSKVQASSEECAIFAVLGKAKLGWTASAPPPGNYIAESQIARGPSESQMGPTQIYIAQCAWHDLGLADPVMKPEGDKSNYALGHPIMTGSDIANLTWNRFEFVSHDGVTDLHHRFQMCKFVKQNDAWQLESCEAEQDIIRDTRPDK